MRWRSIYIQPIELLCLGGLAMSGVISLIVAVVAPYFLATHTLAVEAFGGTTLSMITAGALVHSGKVAFVIAILLPVLSVVRLSPFYWWAGRRYGHLFIDVIAMRSPRSQRSTDRAEAIFRRLGPYSVMLAYFLPVPNGLIFAVAGWSGMGFWHFLLFDFIDALLYSTVMVVLGYELGSHALAAARLITTDAGLISVGIVIVVVGGLLARRLRSYLRSDSIDPSLGAATMEAEFEVLQPSPTFELGSGGDTRPLRFARQVLEDRLGEMGEFGDAQVIGVALASSSETYSKVHALNGSCTVVEQRSYFELGSLSSVCTAMLLAMQLQEREVTLDESWQAALGRHGYRDITPSIGAGTLGSLATHTSGLPAMSWKQTLLAMGNPEDPFVGFTEHQLIEFAQRRTRSANVYRYSNFGYALIGLALTGSTGDGYEQTLRREVLDPLGLFRIKSAASLTNSDVRICGRRMDKALGPWLPQVLTPALGLVATMDDVARLLAVHLQGVDSRYYRALGAMHRTRAITGDSAFGVGLGWHVYSSDHGHYLTHPIHGPGTSGVVVVDPVARVGVCVLANAVSARTNLASQGMVGELLRTLRE